MTRPLTALDLLAAASAAAAAPPGSDTEAPRPEAEAEVRAALQGYLRSHATGDASHIRPLFHPEAELFFVRDGQLVTWTAEEYMSRFPGEPAADEAERHRRITRIEVTGSAATATIELDYPRARFTDYFALLRIGGQWKVVNKTFHAEPAGS